LSERYAQQLEELARLRFAVEGAEQARQAASQAQTLADRARQAAAGMQGQLEAARASAAESRAQADKARRRAENLERALQKSRAELERWKNSRSFRLTAPLRTLASLLRRRARRFQGDLPRMVPPEN
jgi:dsDNA-specific endonuclease/ATPase MutS2